MRFLAILAIALAAVQGSVLQYTPGRTSYHDTVGVPTYNRIRQAELARDFDGARIVGGIQVDAGTHPYLGGIVIHLANGATSMCGSSLLTNTRALTAAHCWYDGWRHAVAFTMVYGSRFLHFGGTRIYTTQIEMHENWNIQNFQNDIAIVSHDWVWFNALIRPIRLPSGAMLEHNFARFIAVASGFGRTSDTSSPSLYQDKREVTLTVMSNEDCRARFGPFIVDSTLCTTAPVGQNICSGDSGGPLAIGEGDNRVLIGVTSFGAMRCESGEPSGFARVTSFVNWIRARVPLNELK